MKIFHSLGHVVGGSLLIAGTAIGVGMLALPVATGTGGFVPSVVTYIICWMFMLCTGLLLVEVSMWMPKDTGFISMAEKILGPIGKSVFWFFYLFLFTSVMIAHSVGGGAVLLDITGWQLPHWVAVVVYTLAIAPIIYLGTATVDRLNMVLISGVVFCYFAFIAVSSKYIDTSLLTHINWPKAFIAFPILFTAFTYQVIIPTLVSYMDKNLKKIRLAVIIGSTIPLFIYLLWQFVILGIIPTEDLISAGKLGHNAIIPLKELIPSVFKIGKYFAFFAMTTSYVPLALSFFDFLADGLHWKKQGVRRFTLTSVVFGIPMLIAIAYPKIFLIALGYAGGISCAFLFGFMPPYLVWHGRYRHHYEHQEYRLPGGKPILVILMVFAALVLTAELFEQIL